MESSLAFKKLRRSLRRPAVFTGVIVFLLAVTALNLFVFRHEFTTLVRSPVDVEAGDVERWKRWANHYDRLFGMLPWGERVGVQLEGWKSSGILLTRTEDGIEAEERLFLRTAGPGVILTFQREAADELLASVPETPPGEIWQMIKDRLYERRISVWSDPDLERLHDRGYLAFLRAIDTRPPNLDWPTIRRRLGEIER